MALAIGKMEENEFSVSREIWSKTYERHKSIASYIIILLSLFILLLLSFSSFERASGCFSRTFLQCQIYSLSHFISCAFKIKILVTFK